MKTLLKLGAFGALLFVALVLFATDAHAGVIVKTGEFQPVQVTVLSLDGTAGSTTSRGIAIIRQSRFTGMTTVQYTWTATSPGAHITAKGAGSGTSGETIVTATSSVSATELETDKVSETFVEGTSAYLEATLEIKQDPGLADPTTFYITETVINEIESELTLQGF